MKKNVIIGLVIVAGVAATVYFIRKKNTEAKPKVQLKVSRNIRVLEKSPLIKPNPSSNPENINALK